MYVKNGVGLIITGAIGISESALSNTSSCLLAHQRNNARFSKLTESVHNSGGKIAAQLCHSGVWTGRFNRTMNREAIAPSRIPDSKYTDRPGFVDNYHAAEDEEIQDVVTAFGDAAARAVQAGFDAVEVHGAHDSLLAQFLSPITNRHTDRWGGSLKDRVRIHCEVARAIRSRVGSGYPVILKFVAADGISSGHWLGFNEGRQAA